MNELTEQPAAGHRRIIPLLACLGLTLLLSACASTGSTKKHPVEQRAQQRWDAVLAKDYATAYTYYSPGYRSANSAVDLEISQRTRRVMVLAASVDSSECDADACTVTTIVQYRVGAPIPGVPKWESDSKVQERWVRTEGNWWYVPEQ